jgi:hypothetical protein
MTGKHKLWEGKSGVLLYVLIYWVFHDFLSVQVLTLEAIRTQKYTQKWSQLQLQLQLQLQSYIYFKFSNDLHITSRLLPTYTGIGSRCEIIYMRGWQIAEKCKIRWWSWHKCHVKCSSYTDPNKDRFLWTVLSIIMCWGKQWRWMVIKVGKSWLSRR